MRQISATDAKAQFAKLLGDVERGETVVITRHGKPIARLEPPEEDTRERVAEAIAEIRRLRRKLPNVSLQEILEARDEGRR